MAETISLLLAYKYWILFPLSIIEGPILTVIGGFFVSLGIMNAFVVYLVVVSGDILGDGLFYGFGRWGSGFLLRHGSRFGITLERVEQVKEYFKIHHHKAISMSKLFHGIGFIGIIVAGILKIPYCRFFKTASTITILQSTALLVIGILFGHAYIQIGKYLNYFTATITTAVLIVIFVVIIKKLKIFSD